MSVLIQLATPAPSSALVSLISNCQNSTSNSAFAKLVADRSNKGAEMDANSINYKADQRPHAPSNSRSEQRKSKLELDSLKFCIR
jgi:hypothetical protein